MRRSRHKLQVSTFPFLAVLLGAMGALILLLLVMDRRSKVVARNRALEAHALQVAARAKKADTTLQDDQARRQEWERKRQDLHDLLRGQEQELAQERDDLKTKLQGLSTDLRNEKQALRDLEKTLLEERARLDVKGQLLAQMRQGIARSAERDGQSKGEVEKLARDLAQLERALEEAKTLKVQEQESYSLVPYRGKLGEGRRPVYVECTALGVVFHPDEQRLGNLAFDIKAFREEVQRRGIELVREKVERDRPNRPPVPKVSTNPYVLFLVRPDGLEAYYHAVGALRGFDLDFGYEFIDAEWALNFSGGPALGGQRFSLPSGPMRPPPLPGTSKDIFTRQEMAPPPLPGSDYSGAGFGNTGSYGGTGKFQPGSPGGRGGSGLVGGMSLGPPEGMANPGQSANESPGTRVRGPGSVASNGTGNGQGTGAGFSGTGQINPGFGTYPPGSQVGSEGLVGGPSNGQQPQNQGAQLARGPGSGSGLNNGNEQYGPNGNSNGNGPGITGPNQANTGLGGYQPGSQGNGSGNSAPGPNSRNGQWPQPPGAELAKGPGSASDSTNANGQPGSSQDVAWRGSPGSGAPNAGDPTGGGTTPGNAGSGTGQGSGSPGLASQNGGASPGGATPGGGGSGSSQGGGGNSGDSGTMDPLARLSPRLPFDETRPGPKKPMPAPSLGRLLSSRDYVLTIECFGDVVAIYPGGQVYAVTMGANQKNIDEAVVRVVQQLIARRQATVRAGETPYRPILRFQIHPDALRTYFHIYPLFENLRIPMTRENLDS